MPQAASTWGWTMPQPPHPIHPPPPQVPHGVTGAPPGAPSVGFAGRLPGMPFRRLPGALSLGFAGRVPRASSGVPFPVASPAVRPETPQTTQATSTPADGSVRADRCGRSLVGVPSPNTAAAKRSRVLVRSAMVRPSSTASPPTWLNTGLWVASAGPGRKTRPVQTTRSGGAPPSIALTCAGAVHARSTSPDRRPGAAGSATWKVRSGARAA